MKVDKIIFDILKKEYNLPDVPYDSTTIFDIVNFLEQKHKLIVSAVKECILDGDYPERWRCFVEVIPETPGAPNRIIFHDAWSLDFSHEEVLINCLYYYFVDKGFIPLLGDINK